ncbi:hypothetical protein F5X68DRAFT_40765 [Plectosphaerella plurivora]|uniref:Rhodopsin domain-containing protein n=1 Tax=Plectosphaerella plurivora TaxID=936078 RepID=A0A9P9A6N4_9PEZI|nr:hypothetical protein F5X68DRAFT_40765 [Plectosphaerella plurivora]
MVVSPSVAFDITVAGVCALLILIRCGYRILSHCRVHTSCHRTWHADDAYMAFALLPLIARTACIAFSFILNPTHSYGPATEADAMARGISVEQLQWKYETSHKLLIPGRIMYALFLWSLKLCILDFYSRFVDVLRWGKLATNILWWFIVITFMAVIIATLTECRPLSLFWLPDPSQGSCHRALANLVTMAVLNMVTDIALIAFPFPILRHIKLDGKAKIQLVILFSIAGVVVFITILRLPLILNQAVSQRSRSMWASIEILCACIVTNAAFYYALLKDWQRGHDSRAGLYGTSQVEQDEFYMQSLPSVSIQDNEPGEPMRIINSGRRLAVR